MKLRSYLILLVAAAVLPVLIFAAAMLRVAYQRQKGNLAQGMIERAGAISAALDREVLISIQSLKVLGASTHLGKGELAEFYGEMKEALAAYSRAWQNLTLADATGQQLINLRRPFGSPLPHTGNPDAVEQARRSKEAVIGNLSPGPVTGAPGIVVHMPVLKDGEVKYFLNAVFYPAPLTELLLQQTLPPGWIATILDRNQIVVARTSDVDKFFGKSAWREPQRSEKDHREAAWRGTTLDGLDVIAALHRSDFTGWTVGVAIPVPLFEAPMRRSLTILAAGGLLLFLTGIGLAFLFGSRISRPVAALSAAAVALGKGKRLRFAPSAIIEVNQAARAIEDAGTQRKQAEKALEKARGELEEKVQERTREITEANAKLQDVDRLKSQFLANMSHELRTPLNAIIGFSELMHDGKIGGPVSAEHKEFLGDVLSSARHLLQLIDDVLDLSKVEAGRMEVLTSSFRIEEIIVEVTQNIAPIMSVKGLKLIRDIPENFSPISSDRRKLYQILLNLVSNAVKFTERGAIQISCQESQGQAQISVSDTGIGIAEEDMRFLFQPFSQIDGGLRKRHEGTGLGLYLSQELAALLGGTVSAESEYGKGSTFTLTIPCAPTGAEMRLPNPASP